VQHGASVVRQYTGQRRKTAFAASRRRSKCESKSQDISNGRQPLADQRVLQKRQRPEKLVRFMIVQVRVEYDRSNRVCIRTDRLNRPARASARPGGAISL